MRARSTTVVAGSGLLGCVLLGSVLLSACATNVGGGYSLDPGRGTGLAVVSLTTSGLPPRFNLFVNLRGVGTAYKRAIPVTDFFTKADWRCPRVGTATEAEPCGRLAVIELPQGEYEFYAWEGGTGGPGVRGTVRSKEEFAKRFRVLAGQARYIGNIHLAITPPKFLTDQGTGTMTVSDLRVRDLPLLHEKHPRVTPDRVVVSILAE